MDLHHIQIYPSMSRCYKDKGKRSHRRLWRMRAQNGRHHRSRQMKVTLRRDRGERPQIWMSTLLLSVRQGRFLYNSRLIQVIANPDGWQKSPPGASYDNFTGQKYITKAFVRPQGPGDQTDPRIALVLTGHKSEVFMCAFNPRKRNILASG